jgi:hypothetical protein
VNPVAIFDDECVGEVSVRFLREEVEVMARKHPSFFGLHKQQTPTCRDSASLYLTSHFTSAASNGFLCTFLFRSFYPESFISRILFRRFSFHRIHATLDNLVPHRLAQSLILAKEIKTGAKIPQPCRIGAFISLEIAINVFSEVSPPLRISVSTNVFSLCDLSQLTSAFAQPLSMSSATTSVHRVLTRQ